MFLAIRNLAIVFTICLVASQAQQAGACTIAEPGPSNNASHFEG